MSVYGYVLVDGGTYLNVRSIPESNGNVVCKLHRCDRVEILTTYQTGWDKIKVSGYETQDTYCVSSYIVQNCPSPSWQWRYGVPTLEYAPTVVNTYVKHLQRDLYSAGYTSVTSADGRFGRITEAAVIRFQSNNSLTADGKAGNNTKKKLWKKLHPIG